MRCCQCFAHDIADHPHKSADSLIPVVMTQPQAPGPVKMLRQPKAQYGTAIMQACMAPGQA